MSADAPTLADASIERLRLRSASKHADQRSQELAMTKVTAQMSISLDGCYAGARHDDPATWLDSDEAAGFFRVTRWAVDAAAWRERQQLAGGESSLSSDVIKESFEAAGAYVMGRRMADGGEVPWGDEPPFRAPVFVVTHRERDTLHRGGGTSFTYVTDGVERAVEHAKDAAGGKDVAIAGGGTLLRQALELGVVNELELHIVPVVLGHGMRLLDLDLPEKVGLELEPLRVLETPDVLHIRYRVAGRAALVLDDRGGALPAVES
jgi:dihydrofolate reductase